MIIYGGDGGVAEENQLKRYHHKNQEEKKMVKKKVMEKTKKLMYDVTKGFGIALLVAPEVIKRSNLMELIDWRFKM